MTETPTSLPEEELIAAQHERIRLLEAEPATRAAPEPGHVTLYDLDEAYVAEGEGTCLECSCEEWRPHREQGGPACWLCGHDQGVHKRHPDGARARQRVEQP
jgi:hypothetical protein